MWDSFLKKLCLVLITCYGISDRVLTLARIVNPCELAITLLQRKVEFSKLPDWICLAHAASRYNSSKVTGFDTNPYHNLQYGIFQLSNVYFCYDEYKQKYNECLLNCTQLADDELDDDITCAQLLYRRGKNSFQQWGPMFSQNCENSTANRRLLEGCEVLNGKPPTVRTNETNVTFTVSEVYLERIQCEARGTPPITAYWLKNQKKIEPGDSNYIVETGFDPESNLTITVLKFNYNASRENVDLFKCQTENLYGRDAGEILVSVRKDSDGSRSSGSDFAIVIAVSSTAVIILVITTTIYWTCLKEYASLSGQFTIEYLSKAAKVNVVLPSLEIQSGLTRAEIKAFENGTGTNKGEQTQEPEFVHETLAVQPYNKEFEIVKSDLIFDRTEVLGTGQYGIVYKGTYRGKPVGIKTIKPGAGKTYLDALLVELKVMIYVRGHGNVIDLVGACTKELLKGIVYVVIEYCPLGSLLGFLKRYRDEFGSTIGKDAARKFQHYDKLPGSESGPIYELQMIGWSYQIAAAMEYLASKKVIHGDLAARNILMLDPQTVKITDFGLSRKLYHYATYIQAADKEPLPFRWLALETLRDLKFSTASDAWSFGITLWEIFSLGQVPYPGLSWSLDFVQRLEAGLRMTKPDFASDSIYNIMAGCWDVNPTSRPNFTNIRQQIFQELKKLSQSEYIELDHLCFIIGPNPDL